MSHTLLVLGGARSGKSRYAQTRIEQCGGRFAYVATAQAFDREMEDRIAHHRDDRDARWTTIEEPIKLAAAITHAATVADAVLVDCLTLWLSNLILAEMDLEHPVKALCTAIQKCARPIALVSNEVGLSIVPDNPLARRFRDEAGRLNQAIATQAKEVQFIAAGLPLQLK